MEQAEPVAVAVAAPSLQEPLAPALTAQSSNEQVDATTGDAAKTGGRIKPSWEYVDVPEIDPLDENDERYRNGAKGMSAGVSLANITSSRRERKTRNLDVGLPPPAKKKAKKKMKKKSKVQYKPAPREESPMPTTFLDLGTQSRGPIRNRPKPLSLAEMYPGRDLEELWMQRATERMETQPDGEWTAAVSAVHDYDGEYPMLVQGEQLEGLKRMWNVLQCVPGEGSTNEPLYGEINLSGVSRVFAIWKELCEFGVNSHFLDVGSGLAKMVFHAAVDPGVEESRGIELSKYRADAAQAIVDQLLPKAGLGHLSEVVQLEHQDVKEVESWEGLTHIYMFDLGFPKEAHNGPYPHILQLWVESSTAQYLISYRRPKFLWQRGFDLELVSQLQVKQQGKGGSHKAYFYRKIMRAEEVKDEVKHEVKSEVKHEVKSEVEDEVKNEVEPMEMELEVVKPEAAVVEDVPMNASMSETPTVPMLSQDDMGPIAMDIE